MTSCKWTNFTYLYSVIPGKGIVVGQVGPLILGKSNDLEYLALSFSGPECPHYGEGQAQSTYGRSPTGRAGNFIFALQGNSTPKDKESLLLKQVGNILVDQLKKN